MTDRSAPHRFTVAAAGLAFRYVNSKLSDGVPQDLAPGLLVYEPRQDSSRSPVAVEYMVPFTVVPATATPPEHPRLLVPAELHSSTCQEATHA